MENKQQDYLSEILQENDIKLIMHMEEIVSPETYVHSKRVAKITELFLPLTDVPKKIYREVIRGALLHDVGKLCVPLNLLSYPFPLSHSQKEIISAHTLIGSVILSDYNRIVREIVSLHHEHVKQIPNYVLLVQTVDIYDALTSNRLYRAKLEADRVKDIMNMELIDTQYVEPLLEIMQNISFETFI